MRLSQFLPLFLLAATLHGAEMKAPRVDLFPDRIILNDGTELRGLIILNNSEELVLQQRMGEKTIPKPSIRRIHNDGHETVYFAHMMKSGTLPPWRMVVQDLRSDDNILSFREIPATLIDNGYLKNIPYLSFRINQRVEMNIYGNPEDPVCLEFGIYERNNDAITKFKKIIRAYLAGIMRSRAEVAALYSLPESGGERRVGEFVFKVLPPTAPDAYGGWWISIYKPAALASARVSDAAYAKLTVPFDQINTTAGLLRSNQLLNNAKFLATTPWRLSYELPDLEGFYRDKMGKLKLLLPSLGTTSQVSQ